MVEIAAGRTLSQFGRSIAKADDYNWHALSKFSKTKTWAFYLFLFSCIYIIQSIYKIVNCHFELNELNKFNELENLYSIYERTDVYIFIWMCQLWCFRFSTSHKIVWIRRHFVCDPLRSPVLISLLIGCWHRFICEFEWKFEKIPFKIVSELCAI